MVRPRRSTLAQRGGNSWEVYERRKTRRGRRTIWEDLWHVLENRTQRPPKPPTKFESFVKWSYRYNAPLMRVALSFVVVSTIVWYCVLANYLRRPQMYMVYSASKVFQVSHSVITMLPFVTYWVVGLVFFHVEKPIQLSNVEAYILISMMMVGAGLYVYNSAGIINLHYDLYATNLLNYNERRYQYFCMRSMRDIRRTGLMFDFSNRFAELVMNETACCNTTGIGKGVQFDHVVQTLRERFYKLDDYACCVCNNGIGKCPSARDCRCSHNTDSPIPRVCFQLVWNLIKKGCTVTYSAAFVVCVSYIVMIFGYLIHQGKMISENPKSAVDQEELDHPFFLLRKTDSDLRRRMAMTETLSPILRRHREESNLSNHEVAARPHSHYKAITKFDYDDDEVYRVRFHLTPHGRSPRHKDHTRKWAERQIRNA